MAPKKKMFLKMVGGSKPNSPPSFPRANQKIKGKALGTGV